MTNVAQPQRKLSGLRAWLVRHRPLLMPQLPFAIVLLIVAIGFVRLLAYHWREGTVMIAGALLLAAIFRALLRNDQVGLIAIRNKHADVLVYAAFGVAMATVAITMH